MQARFDRRHGKAGASADFVGGQHFNVAQLQHAPVEFDLDQVLRRRELEARRRLRRLAETSQKGGSSAVLRDTKSVGPRAGQEATRHR